MPSQEKLQGIADWLEIEPQVLRCSAGAINAILERRQRRDEGIGYQERDVFTAFVNLSLQQRKAVREIILGLTWAGEGEDKRQN